MTEEQATQKPQEPQTPEQIMSAIAAAGASSDITEVVRLGNLLKKHQSDIQKAEGEKLKKEAEELAGVREALAKDIWDHAKSMPKITQRLAECKAQGFTYKLDTNEVQYKSVSLTVPTVKTKSGGGGGGSTGALKSQTGLSRHELVDKYATDTEKGEITKAESEATSRPDSARYSAEKPVIKRILADNPELINR